MEFQLTKTIELLNTDNLSTSVPLSSQLYEILFEECDIFKILASLDPSKAMGIDSIGPRILKHCATSLCSPITTLFKKCFNNSLIPKQWKIHVITPILKGGDPANVANYRPISLLCSISKVMEKLLFDVVYAFMLPFISVSQFGFMKGRSCLQQLLSTLWTIYLNMYAQKQTDIVY